MNNSNLLRSRLIVFALLAVVTLAGCVGTRMGTSWPAISMVELNGEQNIIVSYNDRVDILNPTNGALTRLLNPATGEVRRDENNDPRTWVLSGANYENAQFFANPIQLDEETFIIADYNNRLLEVDTVSATVERTIPVKDHVIADILVVDGTMYIPFQSGGVTAMTIEDYQEIWSFPTEEGVWAKPILVNGNVVFTSMDHNIYAVDKDNGELQWSADLEGSVGSTPLVANDRLYVGSYNKKLFEISLDGEILNTYDTQNWVWGTPAIDENGILYVGDLSGYVHALDSMNNLSEVWSRQVATRGIRSGPVIYEDDVIVTSRDGVVYWLDRRDGVTINDQEIEGKPELLGDSIIIEPSESLDISEPLIIVSTVNTGELLVAFGVDGRQTWVYKR